MLKKTQIKIQENIMSNIYLICKHKYCFNYMYLSMRDIIHFYVNVINVDIFFIIELMNKYIYPAIV